MKKKNWQMEHPTNGEAVGIRRLHQPQEQQQEDEQQQHKQQQQQQNRKNGRFSSKILAAILSRRSIKAKDVPENAEGGDLKDVLLRDTGVRSVETDYPVPKWLKRQGVTAPYEYSKTFKGRFGVINYEVMGMNNTKTVNPKPFLSCIITNTSSGSLRLSLIYRFSRRHP